MKKKNDQIDVGQSSPTNFERKADDKRSIKGSGADHRSEIHIHII